MAKAKVYMHSNKQRGLNVSVLAKMLQSPVLELVSTTQPVKPKGGEVYVLDFTSEPDRKDDSRVDKYRWRQDSVRKYPVPSTPDVTLIKTYFYMVVSDAAGKLQTSAKFKKYISYLSTEPLMQAVEYIGDESLYVPLPHGNSKDKDTEFVRTAPSVMNEIKQSVKHNSAGNVYKKMVVQCDSAEAQGVLNPRNLSQIKNISKNQKAKKRISRDDLYNLIQLAYHHNCPERFSIPLLMIRVQQNKGFCPHRPKNSLIL